MPEELEQKECVMRVMKMIDGNGANGRMLYRILQLSSDNPVNLEELEKKITDTTEFATCTQSPFSLIEWLVNERALDILEYNDSNELITEADKIGLDEDQIDDMICALRIGITPIGRSVLDECDPVGRYEFLVEREAHNAKAFRSLLEFLAERKSFSDLDHFVRATPALLESAAAGVPVSQPSSLIGKLAQAGLVSFDGGWLITPEGQKILDNCRE